MRHLASCPVPVGYNRVCLQICLKCGFDCDIMGEIMDVIIYDIRDDIIYDFADDMGYDIIDL